MFLSTIWRFISYLIILNWCTLLRGEVFTAISDVEPLLETHQRIIEVLEDYFNKHEGKLAVLRYLNIYKHEQDLAMQDIPNYLGNPINAFTLIKRLTTDLDFIEQTINKGPEYIKNITINNMGVKYPTLEDLTGAAQALTRLQDTYRLDIDDLAEGRIAGVNYSSVMTAGDCYELGRALYRENDYPNALAWMMVAERKYTEEDSWLPYSFKEIDILDDIGYINYLLGDYGQALQWTKKSLTVDPGNQRARDNEPHYQKKIDEGIVKDPNKNNLTEKTSDRLMYEALCRGEMEVPPVLSKKLKCRYLTESSQFLKLAPIKMEYKYLDPDIIVFHDVLSDGEIAEIQRLAQPRFKRALVRDKVTGKTLSAGYRISKSGWLHDGEAPAVARVSRRVRDLTGLDLSSAEDLQVVNYGIGGHYEAHYDFSKKEDFPFGEHEGNRIATVLFYMSDVPQGGATVFTELGLSVFPVRGTAVVWLNLHPSAEGNLYTKHAACPVLRGSKWVCNKWLHQIGQELIKPCNLEYQREEVVVPKPTPVSKILV